jgi:hypothetical protein
VAGHPSRRGVGGELGEFGLEALPVPTIGIVECAQLQRCGAQCLAPLGDRLLDRQCLGGDAQAMDVVGQVAGQVEVVALHIAERHGVARPEPGAGVGHRRTDEQLVEAGLPGGGGVEGGQSVLGALRGIEPPADVHGIDPLDDAAEALGGEPEPATDRRTGSERQHIAGSESAVGEAEQGDHGVEQWDVGAQRAVGNTQRQGQHGATGPVAAEHGLGDGGDGRHIGAQNGDVAWFERCTALRSRSVEQSQQHIAQHLHLAGEAVTAVPLHAVVVGSEPRTEVGTALGRGAGRIEVGTYGGLQSRQQGRLVVEGRRRCGHRLDGGTRPLGGSTQQQMRLARSAGPGTRQSVRHHRAGVGRAEPRPCRERRGRAGEALPPRRRRHRRQEVDVASSGQRGEDLEVRGGQAGQPEQQHTLGNSGLEAAGAQCSDVVGDAGGVAGHSPALDEQAPQLGLPQQRRCQLIAGRIDVGTPLPGRHHRHAVQRVAIEQVGDGTCPHGVGGQAEAMAVFVQQIVEGPGERPDRPGRVDLGAADGTSHERAREDELDVRGDAVGRRGRRRTEPLGETTHQPGAHPIARNGNEIAGERIGRWSGQHLGRPVGQRDELVGDQQMQRHARTPG